jgi:peptide/nickel transport system permease protein
MWRYAAQRTLEAVIVIVLVTMAVFAFVHALPGDPVVALVGGQGGDRETIELKRKELGLDRPIPVQYAEWLGGLVTGDLGTSAVSREPILDALGSRVPVTFQLAVASFLVSLAISLPAGILAAYYWRTWIDRSMTVLALVGVAMPGFWLGILLILLFSVKLGWLPPSGFVSVMTDPVDGIRSLLLPAIALGAAQAGVLMRQTRSSLLEVLKQDYVRTARAKGVSEFTVVATHAMRNALLPVVTVMGLQVGRLLGGSVIIETVFAMPGLGRYAVNAIFAHDYPVIQATVLVTAVVVIFVNLVTDFAYAVLDPRVKLS